MEFFVLKAGPFYLSRWPEISGNQRPFGGELFSSLDSASNALAELQAKRTPESAPIVNEARIVKLTVTEETVQLPQDH